MKARTTGTYAILALAAIGTIVLSASRAVCAEAVYPVERASRSFGTKVWSRICGFFAGAEARAENVRLRREVAALSLARGDMERLESENDRLRAVLGYSKRRRGEWLPAEVLSSGGAAAGSPDLIRVGKGAIAGVREGDVVVARDGLVGRVKSVSPHTAEVALLTDRQVKVACEVESGTGSRLSGILSGGGGLLALKYLSGAGDDIPPRARVFTSGRGGVFPRGLEVGALLDVRTDAEGLVREGEVQPNVDFSTLEDVFIRHGE